MNKILICAISVLLSSAFASAQSTEETPKIEKSISTSAPDVETERLKKELKAPDRKDFSSDEEYLKAKDAWVARNKSSYENYVRSKQD